MVLSRYTRLAVLTGSLLLVIFFFTSTQSSTIGRSSRAKPAAQVPVQEIQDLPDLSDLSDNTLQGKPYGGQKPPYAKGDTAQVDSDKAAAAAAADPGHADRFADTPAAQADAAPKAQDQAQAQAQAKAQDSAASKAKTPESPKDCSKLEFVVMIDAGSTGSRVHVYEFDTCHVPPKLLKEEFEMLKPGLSSFDTDTEGAAKSLEPLIKVALDTVPEEKRGCTPIALKATAGLRMLGTEKSNAILARVRSYLEDLPFAVVNKEFGGVAIMDGSDEGVYAWITTNYLLGNIGSPEETPTAAVFDLGGGSTQVVFQPLGHDDSALPDGDHKYSFSFAGRDFVLYQHSHLGYGLMEARHKINSLVVNSAAKNNEFKKYGNAADAKAAEKADGPIVNPCLAPGVVAKDVIVKLHDTEWYKVTFKGPENESGAHCRFLAETVLNLDGECVSGSCSFNGVFQPSLTSNFDRNSDMYIFSYFYDRTNPLGFPSSFTMAELSDLAKTVCTGEQLWRDVLLGEHVDLLNEEPQWCLDLSFITAMLHTGYDIPLHRELRTAKTIANNELGWCLGASLPLLDKGISGWTCKPAKGAEQAV